MADRRIHVVAVAATLLVTAAVTPAMASLRRTGPPAAWTGPVQDEGDRLALGRELYDTGCASCHGPSGEGVIAPDGGVRGPSLMRSGEAAAFYYVSTGRMPLAGGEEQPQRKPAAYSAEEIDALVAYVASLGDGPALPEVDTTDADLDRGGVIYRANCQACHSASGSGGALSYGDAAPPLGPATQQEIAAAVRAGPGQMPVFGPDVIDEQELNDLVSYVEYLDSPDDPGGLPIGRTGPIAEGFVAWLVGMVALIGAVAWIGTRSPVRRRRA